MVKTKKILKEWDTFACKINSDKYPEFNDRYLILIRALVPEWNLTKDREVFYVKITKENRIPTTKEEIEHLEYIKMGAHVYNRDYYKFPDKFITLKPDKYGLVYQYLYKLLGTKNIPKDLVYIGNYEITKPQNNFIPDSEFDSVTTSFIENLNDMLLMDYCLYNLKKSFYYTKETQEELKNTYQEYLDEIARYDKFKEALDGPYGKEILKQMGIDIDNEKREDSLTYVGGEKESFEEK